jgi:hypothetical protein
MRSGGGESDCGRTQYGLARVEVEAVSGIHGNECAGTPRRGFCLLAGLPIYTCPWFPKPELSDSWIGLRWLA